MSVVRLRLASSEVGLQRQTRTVQEHETLEQVKFGKSDIENVINKLTPQQIDDLAFGAIQLDATGRILTYNLVVRGRHASAHMTSPPSGCARPAARTFPCPN